MVSAAILMPPSTGLSGILRQNSIFLKDQNMGFFIFRNTRLFEKNWEQTGFRDYDLFMIIYFNNCL